MKASISRQVISRYFKSLNSSLFVTFCIIKMKKIFSFPFLKIFSFYFCPWFVDKNLLAIYKISYYIAWLNSMRKMNTIFHFFIQFWIGKYVWIHDIILTLWPIAPQYRRRIQNLKLANFNFYICNNLFLHVSCIFIETYPIYIYWYPLDKDGSATRPNNWR